jgi:predicted RNA-binding protein with PUA-like domain
LRHRLFIANRAVMRYWLLKSEPDAFSFDDLKKRARKTEPWNGVRNYQARNYMRDDMNVGDLGLFYHSSCAEPGVAGIVRITKEAYPDHTQFDPKSEYFDEGSKREDPRWVMVDVTWEADVPNFVGLPQLREDPALAEMLILRRGNRLSITPVEEAHFKRICKLGGVKL